MGRPCLHDHVPVFRRGPRTLQVGFGASGGIILPGLSRAEMALVERLDGSLDESELRAGAERDGCAPDRVEALLRALRARSLLADLPGPAAPPAADPRHRDLAAQARTRSAAYGLPGDGSTLLAARAARRIVVGGSGTLVPALRAALLAGGFGEVSAGLGADAAADFDLRAAAEAGRAGPAGPGGAGTVSAPRVPDLVVLVRGGAIPPGAGEEWRRRSVPLLPVVVEPTRVVVGPLVVPRGPCLRCLDLHRLDADPCWPAILEQLLTRRGPAEEILDAALPPLAAGVGAAVVSRFLDTGAGADGTGIDVLIPEPRLVRRRWPPHPRCACASSRATMAR